MTMLAKRVASNRKNTVIIALGSHGRGDDGVGLFVARLLSDKLAGCSIIRGQDDPMAILNAWQDAALAIIVDAAVSQSAPGTIHRLELDAAPLPRELARCSSHGVGLAEAVEIGRILGRMPERLIIYAVEADNFNHGVSMTKAVSAAAVEVSRRIEVDVAVNSAVEV
jgi:hydrogenase maturation protease